jgi:thiol-disulfide isomerase/thioredoxin
MLSQGHQIEVFIKNLKNQDVILGHHFNEQLVPDDTITLNAKGEGVFKGKEAFPGGMYFLFLPNKNLFDFILDADQEFSIIADTFNFSETVSFKGSEENLIFKEYEKKVRTVTQQQEELMKSRELNKQDGQKVKEIDKQINAMREEINSFYNKVLTDNPSLFFIKFLKATRRPEVPPTITDKEKQYYWFRNHYFDNFDVSDPRLLRTPIYQNTIDIFVDKVLMQHPDTLISEIDLLIEKSRTNKELFRFMLVHMFNKFQANQMMTAENVFVHIADKYYIKDAEWSDAKFINELKGKIANKKKCLVGNQAYNINYQMTINKPEEINHLVERCEQYKNEGIQIEKSNADSIIKYNLKVELLKQFFDEFKNEGALKNVEAEYTILWFWTPDCSHCRKETPEFYKLYLEKDLKSKNVKVISFFMQKDITDWTKFSKVTIDWLEFINEHQLYEWINAWNPFDSYRINYDLSSSPILYLLDKDKKIIAKKISYEQAIEIIEGKINN